MLRLVEKDAYLAPFAFKVEERHAAVAQRQAQITNGKSLSDFATGYLFYGLHPTDQGWVFREWAPNARQIHLIGDFSDWRVDDRFALAGNDRGQWELEVPDYVLKPGQHYKLFVRWDGGEGYRLPVYGRSMTQDDSTKIFSARVPDRAAYTWKIKQFDRGQTAPFIYEAHVGMASEQEKVATFAEFRENVLPRIAKLRYNTIQLMAIQEHPYYGSFGYHVSNFFAVSSRFGSCDDLKSLVDRAHEMGIAVIMDIVHSHAVKNVDEGPGEFDGTKYQYFHDGARRYHSAWDSLCFDYGKPEVLHFLLSNCKYWIEEFKFDGFRFDGVTSMMYLNHGMGVDFSSYDMYYDGRQDEDAITYLALANKLIHELNPNAITIAEDMSGMPGLAAPYTDGGYGFDYRLAMGIPDYWIKVIKEKRDEQWSTGSIFHEMTNHRADEKTISYAESHDQALVGDKTIMFRLADQEMYHGMSRDSQNLVVDRAVAIHKMIRLVVLACSGGGYLNFMGNEFGHPEWIDFPREGNGWSYKYARRQWNLVDDGRLRFHHLAEFDRDMVGLVRNSHILDEEPRLRNSDENNQVLFFQRGSLYFVFNFNPTQSFPGYDLPADPGNYRVVLCSDRTSYGGFQRLDESITYETRPSGGGHALTLYVPNRTAVVLRRAV